MDTGEFLTPTLGKICITLICAACYLNPWTFEVPLAGLLLVIYLPLKYAAVSLSASVPGLLRCSGEACFPNSPVMVLVVFLYTYIIVSAIISACGFISGALRFEKAEGAVKE